MSAFTTAFAHSMSGDAARVPTEGGRSAYGEVSGAPASRTYGGLESGQRQAARRARLMAAVFRLVADRGLRRTSVGAICRTARLSNRDFYATFADLHTAVETVYQERARQALSAAAEALHRSSPEPGSRIAAAVRAYLRFVLADERRVRFLHPQELPTDTGLITLRRRFMSDLLHLAGPPPDHPRLAVPPTSLMVCALLGAMDTLVSTAGLPIGPAEVNLRIDTGADMVQRCLLAGAEPAQLDATQ
ncbi:TetR/AcrR family transcriptional regulator [Sphaerisporangium sp. NPDC049003]|uniref:TetR/AcrR family transcriptional regulator n=1 Tax=Sphaerisporangium sp. NPDC049003 TaxID=3364517 RepID=UPI0037209082